MLSDSTRNALAREMHLHREAQAGADHQRLRLRAVIASARAQGASLAEIAAATGLTKARIQQLVK